MKYTKLNEKELQVEVTEVKTEAFSYDRIQNDIQELEAKLADLYKLKEEADKLGLTR